MTTHYLPGRDVLWTYCAPLPFSRPARRRNFDARKPVAA